MTARRLVKTASDLEAQSISSEIKDIDIEDLAKMPVPKDLAKRSGAFERTIYRIHGKIETVEKKKDGDYYLVMRGKHGGETVVEVPDPALCKDSKMISEITDARKAIEEKYHPTPEKKTVNEDATLVGVGFYGWGKAPKRGSTGYSGPRLMPGTGIEFGS